MNPPNLNRVAFSPGEFAELFGKSQTWGYRQIYSGKVKAITEHGRILIPAAEVEAILKTAGVYDGMKPKAKKTKAELQNFAPKLQNAWQSFLFSRRQATGSSKSRPQTNLPKSKAKWPPALLGHEAAINRLTGRHKGKPDR